MPQESIATPTISAAAYASANAIGDRLTFDLQTNGNRVSGWVVGAIVIDRANQAASIDVVLFNTTFTATPDNAPMNPSDDDLVDGGVGYVSVTTYSTFAGNALGVSAATWIPFYSPDGNLYGQLVSRGTPTYGTVSDLTVKLLVLLEA